MSSLRLVHLTKRFGAVAAVDDVSLEIPEGQFVTLLGPSGCGKTTTLRLIAGFESPTSGLIELDGRDITGVPANRREMALVFQSYALFPHLSVFENVAYGLRVRRVPASELKTRVMASLAMVGLDGLEGRAPSALSGGQQQRVALARAMVVQPRVLLFDEPLSNLDAKLRLQMRDEIRRLQRALGITAIYVTHDQAEAMALSDTIVVMNAGRVDQAGGPTAIYHRPATHFVADFIGRASFLPGMIADHRNGTLALDVLGRELILRHPLTTFSGAVDVVVRPEAVQLTAVEEGAWSGVIRRSTFLGSHIEYEVDVTGLRLLVVDSSPLATIRPEGERIGVSLVADALHILPANKSERTDQTDRTDRSDSSDPSD